MTAASPVNSSVVVSTYNRAESLEQTLDSLTRLDPHPFEVIVVEGPSTDGTAAMLDAWNGRIKRVHCPIANLSASRNLGIAAAAGEIIAFIDDDACPDPAWLVQLAVVFEDPEVAGAGGPTLDHSGSCFQAYYSFANRFGEAWVEHDGRGPNPTALMNRPGTRTFAYPIGTNAAFRRDALVAIGGFDEQFDYYLDETDVAVRLIDRGYVVAAVEDAIVHHKFLPNHLRTSERALRLRFPVLKNHTYFGLRHGLGHSSFADVAKNLTEFQNSHRADIASNVLHGLLTQEDAERFEADIHHASEVGFGMWQEGPKLHDSAWFATGRSHFLRFPTVSPSGSRLHLCFLTQEYPPRPVNGIGRITSTLARALADEGHVVRVITDGVGEDRVDLEHGVWVHRLVAREHVPPHDVDLPPGIWNRSATALAALKQIDAVRPLDLIQAPNWDVEAIAALREGTLPVAIGLHTPIATSHRIDPELMDTHWIDGLLRADRWCYEQASVLMANGPTVVEEIEQAYGLALEEKKIRYVYHGLRDDPSDGRMAQRESDGNVRLVFVGRLEHRKGIDAVLDAAPDLLALDPGVYFTIVGDDSFAAPGGGTYRARFEATADPSILTRVRFAGRVSDVELYRLLDDADIVLAPSRFESFGLVALEAMMRSKAVVVGDTPAMRAVVEGGAGVVVDPDDLSSFFNNVAELIRSPERRSALGDAARKRFRDRYQASTMAEKYVEAVRSILSHQR